MMFVRVDDYPKTGTNLGDFKKFDSIMKEYNIPYLLGVTPYLCSKLLNPKCTKYRKLTKNEIKILHNLKDVEIAMHGITHQTRNYGFIKRILGRYSEFIGLSEYSTANILNVGFRLFKQYKLKKPKIFIPPFNAFDEENLRVFRKYFKFITGGPETNKTIKRVGGSWLIISDDFHYGHSYNIYIGPDELIKSNKTHCITLHWSWEVEDNFSALKRLLMQLKGNVTSWRKLK